MKIFERLIENAAQRIGFFRTVEQDVDGKLKQYPPELLKKQFQKTWVDDKSENSVVIRKGYRQDATIALDSFLDDLGNQFADIAASEQIILSESRKPGSLGLARYEHGQLIATLIKERVEVIKSDLRLLLDDDEN